MEHATQCDAQQTGCACREKNSRWDTFWDHSDTNNTLSLISLIGPFLGLKVYYSGKSTAVVFSSKETLPCRAAVQLRGSTKDRGCVVRLTLIFVPSSSGSGSGIISIWEHRKKKKALAKRERLRALKTAKSKLYLAPVSCPASQNQP